MYILRKGVQIQTIILPSVTHSKTVLVFVIFLLHYLRFLLPSVSNRWSSSCPTEETQPFIPERSVPCEVLLHRIAVVLQ